MNDAGDNPAPVLSTEDEQALQEVLGYLNFAGGKPDPRFQRHLNRLHEAFPGTNAWVWLRSTLLSHLERFQAAKLPAFQKIEQAQGVVRVVFDHLVPEYQRFHRDLFAHLPEITFHNSFLLARFFEAALAQGGPWEETPRIVDGALSQLNDFLGHRPIAVLESGQQMQPYPHERFRPIPLYLTGVGGAGGSCRQGLDLAL